MPVQYTYDDNGTPVGVFIPIQEWSNLTVELKKTNSHSRKNAVLTSVERGMMQVREIEKGKLKSISLKELLDAL